MSTKHSTHDKTSGTDPRPSTIFLGIDSEGNHHLWRRDLNRVHVVDPETGNRHERVQFYGQLLDDWMAYVADGRGWQRKRYGVGLVELLAEGLDA